MAVDLNRIIQAAAEAALENQIPSQGQQQDGKQRNRKGLTAPRALLVGAGIAAAGRLLVRARGSDALGNLQQRLATIQSDLGLTKDEPEDEEYGDEEFDEEEEVDDQPYNEEEPEGEYDEGEEPDGEYEEGEEPEGEYEEGEAPEGEYDEDELEDQDDEEEPEPPRRRSQRAATGGRSGRR